VAGAGDLERYEKRSFVLFFLFCSFHPIFFYFLKFSVLVISSFSFSHSAGMPYGAPVDVYGFGVTMFELLSRQEFFIDCEHDYMIASNVMEGIRPELPPQVIPEYKALLEACWTQQANDRYVVLVVVVVVVVVVAVVGEGRCLRVEWYCVFGAIA
jgi:hypothetical protein